MYNALSNVLLHDVQKLYSDISNFNVLNYIYIFKSIWGGIIEKPVSMSLNKNVNTYAYLQNKSPRNLMKRALKSNSKLKQ